MKAGICSVGTELVIGETTDTNAAWLARRLVEVGAEVTASVAVPDDHATIVAALRWLVERCDAVVVGGGLGPTPDDLTRAAVAEVAGVALERRPDLVSAIEAVFAHHEQHMGPANLQQADVPAGATALEPVGTAPGFTVEVARGPDRPCVVYAVPGVPHELRAMIERDVLPDLLRRGGTVATVSRTVHVTGMGESAVAEALAEVVEAAERVQLAFLAGPDDVRVKVTASADDPEAAHRRVEPVVQEVVRRLGDRVAGVDEEDVAEQVARLLRLTGLTVATAESCTAGGVAARLARIPGATDYLRGGLVAYATDVKSDVLGVAQTVLDEHGPVAAPTSQAMARRVRELFAADVGVAVTCVAGPGRQGGRPVGTVIWALACHDGDVDHREVHLPGDRDTVGRRATGAVLHALRRHLAERVRASSGLSDGR
ncbi:MAG: CinA family nicotinamide mononucleotide deamidase-related protein [Actinomycetota bacterium]|nr:CinA family nicotinamide mononucleotide deamidase-related protein [Actinomycetota bacterium]